MSAISIQQMADRVAALMEERLGTRGTGLEAKLRKAGRSLPRKVRSAAEQLAQAAAMAQNPKLLLRLDHDAIAQAYDICLRHLTALPPGKRRMDRIVGIAASIAFSVLAVVVLLVLVLRWRGYF